jgi:hypothetical protein
MRMMEGSRWRNALRKNMVASSPGGHNWSMVASRLVGR